MSGYETHRRSVIAYWARRLNIAVHIVEDAYQDAAIRYLEHGGDDTWSWWCNNVGSVLDAYSRNRARGKETFFVPSQYPQPGTNFVRRTEAAQLVAKLIEKFGSDVLAHANDEPTSYSRWFLVKRMRQFLKELDTNERHV